MEKDLSEPEPRTPPTPSGLKKPPPVIWDKPRLPGAVIKVWECDDSTYRLVKLGGYATPTEEDAAKPIPEQYVIERLYSDAAGEDRWDVFFRVPEKKPAGAKPEECIVWLLCATIAR